MRHRYRVDLYDDVPVEAQLADFLESMPRSRRQEILRTLLKAGFMNTYGSHFMGDVVDKATGISKLAPYADSGRSIQKVMPEFDSSQKNKPQSHSEGEKNTNSAKINNNGIKADDKRDNGQSEIEHNFVKKSSLINEEFNIPSIISDSDNNSALSIEDKLTQDSEQDDGEVVDSLEEFNGLFSNL